MREELPSCLNCNRSYKPDPAFHGFFEKKDPEYWYCKKCNEETAKSLKEIYNAPNNAWRNVGNCKVHQKIKEREAKV